MSDELRDIYNVEAREQVATLEVLMVELDSLLRSNNATPSHFNEIFRAVHSLKAGTGAMGFPNLMNYLHNFETVLDKLRNGEILLTLELYSVMYDIVGIINTDVENSVNSNLDAPDRSNQNEILNLKKIIDGGDIASVKGSVNRYKITIVPQETLLKDGIDPLTFLDDLFESGEVVDFHCHSDKFPDLQDFNVDSLYLSWELILETKKSIEEIENIFVFVIFQSDIKIEQLTTDVVETTQGEHQDTPLELQTSPTKSKTHQNIRVDTEKLDQLVNLVGELVIAQSRIQNLLCNVADKQLQRSLTDRCNDLHRLIDDLKEGVMSTRMVPIDVLFSQFHRIVKDLATKQGKDVQLNLFGKETELDKNIIEKISDPLKHLIRNCVDHGIEDKKTREAVKKNSRATIELKAYQKDGCVFIEISDDGKGLNTNAILEKAIEKGLIGAEQQIDEDDIHQFIFSPGFSTAGEIADVSGRGVGMDVVKSSVEEMGGHVLIFTEEGKGTTFTIQLPLTLAIIEGLLFRVGDRKFVIPLLTIDETTIPQGNQIQTLEGKAEYLEKRNHLAPLVRLHSLFDIPDAVILPEQAMALHLTVNKKSYALMVDEVIDHQPIVIKGLEQNFEKVRGFGGATILGDGSVVPILDPTGVISLYKESII